MGRTMDRQGREQAGEGDGLVARAIQYALDEVARCLQDQSQATDRPKQPDRGGAADRLLGTLTIADKGAAAASGNTGPVDRVGEAPSSPDGSAQDTATHLRSRVEFEIKESRKNIQYTLSGSAPRVVAFDDSFAVASPRTAFQIAFAQLGWDVTFKQREAYVHALEALNKGKLQDAGAGRKIFPAGSRIKLPGQTAEGGLTWRTAAGTTTTWNDGTTLVESEDGSGYANYQYAGAGVTVRWSACTPAENLWTSAVSKGEGARSYYEITQTSFDAQGRTIERVQRTDSNAVQSIRVIDRTGTVIDLKPGADGEFHGQKTRLGKVLDADVGMTADGRIYSRRRDSGGRLVREFEKPAAAAKGGGEPGKRGDDVLFTVGDPAAGSSFTVTRDGTMYSQLKLASGNLDRVKISGAEILSDEVQKDASGGEHLLRRSATDLLSGAVFQYKYLNDKLEAVNIHRKGSEVLLRDSPDGLTGISLGESGRLEMVRKTHGMLVYKDMLTGAMRAEAWDSKAGHIAPSLDKVDYDPNAGTIERDINDHGKTVQSYAPGRVDMVAPDGTVSGMTITGDVSFDNPSGEAAVMHASGGALLTADGKFESWSEAGTIRADLTEHEASFLKDNPAADRRDLVEIHRLYVKDTATLDRFYAQLERVRSAGTLSDAEKTDLVKSLMHHVAYPAEIYQGSSPTCNVTTLQRDLAVNHPDRYARFVVDAVSDGRFETADGRTVRFDVDNLIMRDFSGRDLATRVFQTAALNVLRYPRQTFENTAGGTGRFRVMYPALSGPPLPTDQVKPMEGLYMPEIARIRYDLTGESKGQVAVRSVRDLVALFKLNGGGPMAVWVDGNTYPFGDTGPLGTPIGGHVVTITGIEEQPVLRFYVQNQWGLQNDHSSPATAIEAEDLFNNMSRVGEPIALASAPEVNRYYEATALADGSVKYEDKGEPVYDWQGNFVR